MIGHRQEIQALFFCHSGKGGNIVLPIRGVGVNVQVPEEPCFSPGIESDLIADLNAPLPDMVRAHQDVPGSGPHRLHQISRGGVELTHGHIFPAASRPAQELSLSVLQPQVDYAALFGIAAADGKGAYPLVVYS